ncbi:MAG: N,N-dimethylformamidase beta subunit family domain-containing protein [Vicinamibacterales bacterium]
MMPAPRISPVVGTALVLLVLGGADAFPPAAAQTRPASTPPAAAPDPCASPRNRIIAENCKPGNDSSEWDVHAAGDPTIQGFSTDVSVNVGQTASFKIKTHSPKYRIDIYRTGWYGGKGARFITTIRPSAPLPQAQPDCLTDPVTRLLDCGNWGVSASWAVPADAVSGVYIARLIREDDEPGTWRVENSQYPPSVKPPAAPHAYGASGLGTLRNAFKERRASHIIFIVRDDGSRSDIVMQTSDIAWATYNRYGGSSTYGSWIQGTAAGRPFRAFKVSYNRPNTNREWQVVNNYFNAEYPMVRWMERNGYDVSYIAGLDAHRAGANLRNHKLFLSVGHDEYWTGPQRKNVEAARDGGVNLAFLSGNEVFWKVRMEPSIDPSHTENRTIVCYKETHSDMKIDPKRDEWTGTWRDSRWFNPEGPQPENALTGTIFTVNAYRNDPLIVPAKYSKMRFWRNTAVANLKDGEQLVLGDGILGHEWDEDLDNGFRPAGIVHLSETTVDNVQYIQDHGTVYDSGSATHHLTLYRAPSGALVFGAGTVQYTWGLDNFHDNWTGVPADNANRYGMRAGVDQRGPVKALQQATVNLLADMGIQPQNLQGDLVRAEPSTDRTGPITKITSPSPEERVHGTVVVTGTAADAGGVVGGVEVSTDGGETWHPADGTTEWRYVWTVPAGAGQTRILTRGADDSGNIEAPGPGITVRGPRVITQ